MSDFLKHAEVDDILEKILECHKVTMEALTKALEIAIHK
jgi:hypothetical protein